MKKPEIDFNLQTLRDFAKDPNDLANYIQDLESKYDENSGPFNQVSNLGETGVYLRIAGELIRAQEKLQKALEIVKAHNLGIKTEIQQKIRLAHVYQWQKEFEKSNALFHEILAVCQISDEAKDYQDFALQHAGKNFFDQERLVEAQICFEKAWELRKERKASKDQIQSSHNALLETSRRLGTEDIHLALGRALIANDEKNQRWKLLDRLGKYLRMKVHPWRRWGRFW